MSFLRQVVSTLISGVLLFGCGMDVAREERGVKADPAPEETAGPTVCDPATFPPNRPQPKACCQDGNEQWLIIGAGGGATAPENWLGHRLLGNPCTLADGVTPGCAGAQCAFGPCRGRPKEQFAPPAHVFYPSSDPTVCGRQATGLPGVPEEWTEAHTPYPAVENSCPFTDCLVNGTPVVKLTVTAVASGTTGHVKSIPGGIDLTGAGTASGNFADLDVKLSAEPVSRRARVVFSGACSATGDYGKDVGCKLTLGPDKTVTVTYECQPGFSCE